MLGSPPRDSETLLKINDIVSINKLPTKEMKVIYLLKKGFNYEFISRYIKVSKTTIKYIKTTIL